MIIDESANLEHSLKQTTMGAFAYAGQVCISIQRVLLHEKIADEFTEKFIKNAENLKKGNPLDEETELSVMIEEKAAEKAQSWINGSKRKRRGNPLRQQTRRRDARCNDCCKYKSRNARRLGRNIRAGCGCRKIFRF